MTNKTTMMTILKNIHLSLNCGRWVFTPGLLPSLAVCLLLPLLLSLGSWQLHRANEKQQLLQQFVQRSHQPPQSPAEYEPVYTPVQVTGHYDSAHIMLLDNRILNHRVGYDVLMPFVPEEGAKEILVNLGWIPRLFAAEKKISIDPSLLLNQITITGITQPPQHNLVLAHPPTELRWPLILEDIRIDSLQALLHKSLYPYILLLSSPGGYAKHWQTVVSVSPARHRGYACQWFALALTLIILYLKLNIRRAPA